MKEANDAFALGVFASEDSAAAKAFLAAAAATDAVAFGITTDAAVKVSLTFKPYNSLFCWHLMLCRVVL